MRLECCMNRFFEFFAVAREEYGPGSRSETNADDIAPLTDDDETTAWANDGNRSTAWLRLEFDRPTTVEQLVMRLGSWRTRSYPLRVTADERTVIFDGVAPRTVGSAELQGILEDSMKIY